MAVTRFLSVNFLLNVVEIWSPSFRKFHCFGHLLFDVCQMKSDLNINVVNRNSSTLGSVNSRQRPFKMR